MPGGFASPSILFLNSWNRVERDYMQQAIAKLRPGFESFHEPCAGAFVMSGVAQEAGFPLTALNASDVHLFSAVLGNALTDAPQRDLKVSVGDLLELSGDPVADGALLLYTQLLCRMRAKPAVHYWEEIVHDLVLRADEHVSKLTYYLEQLRSRLHPGMTYSIEAPWDHMRRISGDEKALLVINPPSYAGAYEKFYDTKGLLDWEMPVYPVWDAKVDLPSLVEESKEWAATILVLQMAPEGECPHPDPIYAHDKRRGANDYIWTNHPDEVREALGGVASRQRTLADMEKLENPMLPADYEVKPDSVVGFQKLTAKQSRFYKDTWIHRLDFSRASCEFAVIVDGFLVGMAGFSEIPLGDEEQSLSMLYCVGAPHNTLKTTRLVKALSLTRCVLESVMNPWFVVTARRVLTHNWTKYPEAKGQRGLMKLIDKKIHPQYGFELVYEGKISDRTVEEVYADWFAKENRPADTEKTGRRRRKREPA